MHISLDDIEAGPNGEMDRIIINEEIFDHVGKRISEGDAALYGRVTYRMMENYWSTAVEILWLIKNLVLHINICAKNRHLCQAPKR